MAIKLSEAAEILGVSEEATQDEVKKAYRKLALKNHPDKAKPEDQAEATAKFQDIRDANEVFTEHFEQQNVQQSQSDPEPSQHQDTPPHYEPYNTSESYNNNFDEDFNDHFNNDFEDTTPISAQHHDAKKEFVDVGGLKKSLDDMLNKLYSKAESAFEVTVQEKVEALKDVFEKPDNAPASSQQSAGTSTKKEMSFDDLINEYQNSDHGKNQQPPKVAEDGSVCLEFASEKDAIKFFSDMAEKGHIFTLQDASGNTLASSDGTGLTRPDGSSLKNAEGFKNDAEQQERPSGP